MMNDRDENSAELILTDELCRVAATYDGELEDYILKATGSEYNSLKRSVEQSAIKALGQGQAAITYFIKAAENAIEQENSFLQLTENARFQQAVLNGHETKSIALAEVEERAKYELIPVQNECVSLGKNLSQAKTNIRNMTKEANALSKMVKSNITHYDAFYGSGLLLFGSADAWALQMTLTSAGFGENQLIEKVLPVFAILMAFLAHMMAHGIREKQKAYYWVSGFLSGSILLSILLLRLISFHF